MDELDGRDFLGRPLKVKPCIPKAKRDNPQRDTGYVFDRWQRKDAAQHFQGYARTGRHLIVKGLPKPSTQEFMQ
ncbi:uncharacterized protein BJX67DRAFT_356543 [Aspergillus lucknowensis]|uniref:Uncharacterized protein n=1 Tax=Aspergillus lucknowensis TaxID=176173 RepID=A0ABR4LNG3_9EURO